LEWQVAGVWARHHEYSWRRDAPHKPPQATPVTAVCKNQLSEQAGFFFFPGFLFNCKKSGVAMPISVQSRCRTWKTGQIWTDAGADRVDPRHLVLSVNGMLGAAGVQRDLDLAGLVDVLCVPVVVSCGQQLIHANQAALQLFGFTSSEALVGQTMGVFIRMGWHSMDGADWQDVVHFDHIVGQPQGPHAHLASIVCPSCAPPTGLGACNYSPAVLPCSPCHTAVTALMTSGSRRALTMYSSQKGDAGEVVSVLCPRFNEDVPAVPASPVAQAPTSPAAPARASTLYNIAPSCE
jgi:PAS domain-containing protein